jgi:uncharacterized membrane protein YfcA
MSTASRRNCLLAALAAVGYWVTASHLDLWLILWIVAGYIAGGTIGKVIGLRAAQHRFRRALESVEQGLTDVPAIGRVSVSGEQVCIPG